MKNSRKELSIWEHLDDLRKRLLYALIGLIISVVVSFIFTEDIIGFLAIPIGGLQKLQAIEVTENVGVYMRVALLSGFILSLPWILLQLLKFVVPGLTISERKWLIIAIPFATLLFVTGVGFAFFIMLPAALPFLTEFLGIQTTLRVKSYIDFITNLMFWIGVSFELPLVMFILARLGIVSAKGLAKAWRIAVILIAVLAAIITPTVDPVNMALFMLPLFVLYLLSILLAGVAWKSRNKNEGVN